MYWNKWYYKIIVLNIGPRMRTLGPSAARPRRSARSRPLATARLAPPLRRAPMELTPLPTVSIRFNAFQSVSIWFNPFQSDLIVKGKHGEMQLMI